MDLPNPGIKPGSPALQVDSLPGVLYQGGQDVLSLMEEADAHEWVWLLYMLVGMCAQSCPTLCDHMDYCQPGSSVHVIFQARILEWVAISFSREYS